MSYVQQYIQELENNNVNFLDYCKFAYKKYRFENYSMKNNEEIADEHYIIKGENRKYLKSIINSGSCTKKNLTSFFDKCSEDDLSNIGI